MNSDHPFFALKQLNKNVPNKSNANNQDYRVKTPLLIGNDQECCVADGFNRMINHGYIKSRKAHQNLVDIEYCND